MGSLDALNMYTKSLRNSLTEEIKLISVREETDHSPVRRMLTYPEVEVVESDSYELPE